MKMSSTEHRFKVLEFTANDGYRAWQHEPGVRDPIGHVNTGYVVIDVRDHDDWDALQPLMAKGAIVQVELDDGTTRAVQLTDQRVKDVEVIEGRPVTVSVAYGWEAVGWDVPLE